jgi:hypothetical protein
MAACASADETALVDGQVDAPSVDASGSPDAGPDGSPGTPDAAVNSNPDAAVSCSDPVAYEPNESEGASEVFSPTDDCDENGGTATGVINGTSDADWCGYSAVDTGGCVANPYALVTATAPVRACLFIECTLGNTVIDCPSGTTAATSPNGRSGCCATGAAPEIEFGLFDLDCDDDNDEDVAIYIRIDEQAAACASYTLDYNY